MTKEESPKLETSVPNSVFMLTETTYRHWAMRMNVDLEAQGLMKLIEGNRKSTQKDYLVLSMILHSLWNLNAPILTSRRVPQRIWKFSKYSMWGQIVWSNKSPTSNERN